MTSFHIAADEMNIIGSVGNRPEIGLQEGEDFELKVLGGNGEEEHVIRVEMASNHFTIRGFKLNYINIGLLNIIVIFEEDRRWFGGLIRKTSRGT